MDVRIMNTFRIDFSKDEFLLVSKALRGTLDAEERQAAQELQKRMLRARHQLLHHLLSESQKAIDNVDAAERVEASHPR